jgi:hypothetical protein
MRKTEDRGGDAADREVAGAPLDILRITRDRVRDVILRRDHDRGAGPPRIPEKVRPVIDDRPHASPALAPDPRGRTP